MAEACVSVSPACILLVYGIPGSGKTMLVTALLEHCRRGLKVGETGQVWVQGDVRISPSWNVYAVHFDEFYPPDLREHEGISATQFHLKQARQRVHSCLERFIRWNHLGCSDHDPQKSKDTVVVASPHEVTDPSPSDWDMFVQSLGRHCSQPRALDANGRIIGGEGKSTILLLDDNMPLRSMRYEYFQLARKYLLGYAEVCIQCSLPVALERNSKRHIPIPNSTIETMEQGMELPDPTQHHWEKRSIVINSDCEQQQFIHMAMSNICSLVEDALINPVQPLPEVNMALKETCKLANLNSYVHQADNILRKCISESFKMKPSGTGGVSNPAGAKEAKASLARRANKIRKQILDEIRAGYLCGKPLDVLMTTETAANSDEFRRLVADVFSKLLKD